MACVSVVNEGSSRLVNVAFFDEDGQPFVPSSLSIEVLCMTTGTLVAASAALANPAAVMDIELTAAYNVIVNRANERELRRVVLTSIDANGKPRVDPYEYYVRRIGLP